MFDQLLLSCVPLATAQETPLLISTDLATACLARHWGLQGILSRLDGEQDANFRVRTGDRDGYVLKIVHRGCPPDSVDFQAAALAQLQPLGLNLPQVIKNCAGETRTSVDINGEIRQAWLLRWCPGTLLAEHAPLSADLVRSFGFLLARVTDGLAGFEHPAMRRGHRWELSRAAHITPLLAAIEGEAAPLAGAALAAFQTFALPHLESLPWGVVHNDANDYNVLVEGDRVTGLIDFGDMSWQPIICDVAIALAYLILDREEPLAVCADFLRAYAAQHPLREEELDILFELIRARLAVSLAISSHRQKLEPDDPYITISQAPVRRALLTLARYSRDEVSATFRRAAGL